MTLLAAFSLSPAGAVPDARADGLRSIPPVVLWAWERPEDLRGLAGDVGVAFLSQTITLGEGVLDVRSRRHPLRVGPRTRLVAVTRIEIPRGTTLSLDDESFGRVVESIARTADLPQVAAVQVDFDATRSQRRTYTALLRRLRERLDRAVPLSVTALASWCAGDRWLDQVPIDEAVAMLFRLGPDLTDILYGNRPIADPVFLSAAERGQAAAELAAFRAAGDARAFLTAEAIASARAVPADPDAAEALARAIEGWRRTCGSSAVESDLPLQAFRTLHRQYPTSEWARRTPYWYR